MLIIGWLDRPFWRGCDSHPHPRHQPAPARGLARDHQGRRGEGGGLILTDPTVWTREARGALAPVPVVPVDAGSTVVAAGRK